jgi:hypothetical protein
MLKTLREIEQYDLAVKYPAEVLKEAVLEQARNSVFSEAYCQQLSNAYAEAGEIAKARRKIAPRYASERANLTISGEDKFAVI